jgi:hypothetical protein
MLLLKWECGGLTRPDNPRIPISLPEDWFRFGMLAL